MGENGESYSMWEEQHKQMPSGGTSCDLTEGWTVKWVRLALRKRERKSRLQARL